MANYKLGSDLADSIRIGLRKAWKEGMRLSFLGRLGRCGERKEKSALCILRTRPIALAKARVPHSKLVRKGSHPVARLRKFGLCNDRRSNCCSWSRNERI